MRVLVLGGHGMAGHVITKYLTENTPWDVWCTVRSYNKNSTSQSLLVDVVNHEDLLTVFDQLKPDIVINSIGLLNQQADDQIMDSIYLNSLFPHLLENYSQSYDFRLIHISTDCVFSGKEGDYVEDAIKDGTTVYAKTKSLGEITNAPHATIRTSIIGPELKKDGIGLFHWFMHQSGEISGYNEVMWNGVSTIELAKAIAWMITHETTGLVHLTAPQKISKYDLLHLFKKHFNTSQVQITPNHQIRSNKCLVNTREDFTFPVSSYDSMIQELKAWIDASGKEIYPYYF